MKTLETTKLEDIDSTPSSISNSVPNHVETFQLKSSQITSSHRFAASMYSGWGPHLGRVLRDNSNSLWFVGDTGNDVNHNPRLNYFKFNNERWELITSQVLLGFVQQNVASVTDGIHIYSYGVDVRANRIVECRLRVLNPTDQSCNYLNFMTGGSANYIGATITKSGRRFVWYTNVRSSSGLWTYIYSNGTSGWSVPISHNLNGYSDFSYVYLRLSSDETQFEAIGGAAKGVGGSVVGYDAVSISGDVGGPTVKIVNLKSDGIGMDIWTDANGGTHGLLYPGAQYVYKSRGGEYQILSALEPSVVSARFVENDQKLFLITAISGGALRIRSVNKPLPMGPVSWSTTKIEEFLNLTNLGSLTIFSESVMYQTMSPHTLNFAVTGLQSQAQVFHLGM